MLQSLSGSKLILISYFNEDNYYFKDATLVYYIAQTFKCLYIYNYNHKKKDKI